MGREGGETSRDKSGRVSQAGVRQVGTSRVGLAGAGETSRDKSGRVTPASQGRGGTSRDKSGRAPTPLERGGVDKSGQVGQDAKCGAVELGQVRRARREG